MTTTFAGCQLTARDFQICTRMLEQLTGTGSPLVPLLEEKIETSHVVPPDRIDPLTVTLNSRVEFETDDAATERRIIVQNQFKNGLVGLTLPIMTVRGLALLGLRQGQRRPFCRTRQRARAIRPALLYQPEARRFLRDTVRHGPPAKIIDLMSARKALAAHRDHYLNHGANLNPSG